MILKINETTKNATLTADSNISNYPVTNIQNQLLSKVYRSEPGIFAGITFDCLNAVIVNTIVIDNHNFSDLATIKFMANTVNSWDAPAFSVVIPAGDAVINVDFADQEYRYFRLEVNDSTNVNGYIQMGRVWVGMAYENLGIVVSVPHNRNSSSLKSRSIAGQSYLDQRQFFSIVKVRFPKITEDQYYEIVDLFEMVDIGIPFYVTFNKGGSILKTLYVTYNFEGLNLVPLGFRNLYTTGMDFVQELKG